MLRPLLAALRKLDADVREIVQRVGLTLEELEQPDLRVPLEQAIALSMEAARSMNDPALGIHVAELYVPGVFGVLDYLAHSSRTLGEALTRLCRYNRLLQDAAETRLEVRQGRAIISQHSLAAWQMPGQLVEHSLTNLAVIGRHLTGFRLGPLEVEFQHDSPPYRAELVRVFGAEPHFRADRDVLIFSAEALDLPLINADPNLCSILDRLAQTQLDELPRVAQVSARIREIIAAELRDGGATAARVAKKLRMSDRTLRRRLKVENTTYEQLVDELRCALSEQYLAQDRVSVEEVAFMLGYSDASAYRRAFQRWHGIALATRRAVLRAGP